VFFESESVNPVCRTVNVMLLICTPLGDVKKGIIFQTISVLLSVEYTRACCTDAVDCRSLYSTLYVCSIFALCGGV